MQNIKLKKPIYSFTMQELLDNEDPNFIHRSQYVKELESPVIEYCYANTIRLKIKSSHFGETLKLKDGGTGANRTWYTIFVLFEDFYTIGRDKEIDFDDAIDYAINFGDIHIRCNCKSFLFHGFAYLSTQLKYIYGIPRENRFPKIRNPNLKSTMCKHCDVVLEYLQRNKELVAKMFAEYYNRLKDGQSIYAVNTNGTTITIGNKNKEGDIFFEQQEQEKKEMEELEYDEEELKNQELAEESNVLKEGEEWHIDDPLAGGVDWDDEEEE